MITDDDDEEVLRLTTGNGDFPVGQIDFALAPGDYVISEVDENGDVLGRASFTVVAGVRTLIIVVNLILDPTGNTPSSSASPPVAGVIIDPPTPRGPLPPAPVVGSVGEAAADDTPTRATRTTPGPVVAGVNNLPSTGTGNSPATMPDVLWLVLTYLLIVVVAGYLFLRRRMSARE
ncbi:MAG TPA: hypothetical protein VGT61_14560 [Thermomicrobiales bacterium]|nr:hypothetical protein [Thermomicrobiales bacterium]